MSSFLPSRAHFRAVSFISICAALIVMVSATSRRQEASRRSADLLLSAPLDKGSITTLASTITVNTLIDPSPVGTDGLCSLREAIQAANSNTASGAVPGECVAGSSSESDVINFTVTGTINLTGVLPDITSDMIIAGPGSSQLTVRRSSGGFYRVFNITGGTVSLSGLTVKDGRTADSSAFPPGPGPFPGGGVQNLGTLTMTDVVVTTNQTGTGQSGSNFSQGSSGGGISNNGTLTMTNCTVASNTTGYGGINGSPAVGARGGDGGGIYNTGTLTMTDCVVSGNSTGGGATSVGNGRGGGIYSSGPLTLTSTSINNNSTSVNLSFTGGDGGGIYTAAGQATLTNCSVSDNVTSSDSETGFGGGIRNLGPMTMTGTLVSGNTGRVGGIYNSNVLTMTNTTVSGNHKFTAIESSDPGTVLRLTNCTITGNEGTGVDSLTTPSVRNTIIAGNTGSTDVEGGTFNSLGHNLIGKTTTGSTPHDPPNSFTGPGDQFGTSAAPLDPKLGPLANNGGASLTHALLSNSTALDAGDNCVTDVAHCGASFISQLTTDQRGAGFSRLVDGPDPDTIDTVDIGAFEAQVSVEDISDKTTGRNTQLQFTFNVGGAASITSVTATSSNTTLVPNDPANIAVSGSGNTRTLTINPASNQLGTSTITVLVSGNNSQSMSDTFVLNVVGAAGTPSVTNATTNEDAQSSSGLVISRNAGDGPEVTHFKITNIAGGTLFKNNGTTQINNGDFITSAEGNAGLKFTPAANLFSPGTAFSFHVQAATSAAGANLSIGFATASINVNPVNDTPSFTKGADQIVNEDAGGQTVNWATAISAGPANESGQTLTFQVTGNTNVALFSAGPAVSSTGVLTYTPATDANGTATITIKLNDDGGTLNGGVDSSASQTFMITVTTVNDVPSFTKGADQTVNNNAGAQTVANWATAISAGPANESGQTLTFQTNNSNAALFSVAPAISSTGTLTYTPASNAGGSATVTVNLKDNGGTANGGVDTSPSQTFTINVIPVGGSISFAAASSNTTEDSGSTTVTVIRTGVTSNAATVDYATNGHNGLPCSNASGVASPKCDFTTAVGTLSFAAGETSKQITVLISQDSFVEGPETITLTLSNPTGGAVLGAQPNAAITIADDATEPPTNLIDDVRNFVRQHYHDFLSREPDASGWDFWTNQITSCGSDAQCNEVRHIDVSASFFLSIEFQQSGYLVERFYKVAYGDATGNSTFVNPHTLPVPIVRFDEFLKDTQRIGKGVIVLQPGWEEALENNKRAYALEFVQTTRFTAALATTLTPDEFVTRLNQNTGGVLSLNEKTAVVNLFGGAANSSNVTARAQAVRMVADDTDLLSAEYNRAFVLAEYFGYLRRNPNDAPEPTLDYTGYDFWLTKLNQFNGNYINAEMVKAFLSSIEYRQRFGP